MTEVGCKLVTSESAIQHATDCAMEPGPKGLIINSTSDTEKWNRDTSPTRQFPDTVFGDSSPTDPQYFHSVKLHVTDNYNFVIVV